MDYWKNYIDISSFMLFEATGDSEIDSHESSAVTNGNMGNIASCSTDVEGTRMHTVSSLAEDDAFSCSWDNMCCSNDFHGPSVRDEENEAQYENEDEQASVMDEHDRRGHEYQQYSDYEDEEDEDTVDQVRKAGGGLVNNVIRKRINSCYEREPPGGAVEAIMNMMELAEAGPGRPKKSRACWEPELIKQRDTDADRLFWEACLAS